MFIHVLHCTQLQNVANRSRFGVTVRSLRNMWFIRIHPKAIFGQVHEELMKTVGRVDQIQDGIRVGTYRQEGLSWHRTKKG